MSTHMHGTPRGSTILTWSMGALGETGRWGVAALAVISFWKGAVVILDFMALRRAPLLWRALTMGWMIVVWAVIAIAYIKGLAQ